MSRILPRFDFRVEIASKSEKGPVRETNEDALLIAPELALFGIADGMGGLEGGEIASKLALETARAAIASKETSVVLDAYMAVPQLENRRKVLSMMRRACTEAHTAVLEESEKHDGQSMGTTLDLCLLVRDRAFFAHVGDGRVFLARSSATLLITQDHTTDTSFAFDAAAGRVPRPLTSAIGVKAPLRVDTFFVDLHKNDSIVLTTDGAHGAISDEAQMTRLCQKSPDGIVGGLVQGALDKGGRDNASVIALRICDRFLARAVQTSQRQNDLGAIQQNPLLVDLPTSMVLAALAAGIEVDVEEGGKISQLDAGDLCAYLVLDGIVKTAQGTSLGAPALIFAESLVSVSNDARPATVTSHARLIRIRSDDFREVCSHDPFLGAALYERLARHLARTSPR
jgi:serine/threonine protein phosphatase PrpC